MDLRGQVRFAGKLSGKSLAQELRRHRILVVPSRWAEPFGIVALEGIACGCVVVGSDQGGLVEAIGPCGCTFPNSDCGLLANQLASLLQSPERVEKLKGRAMAHLRPFTIEQVSARYLELFEMVESRARMGRASSPHTDG
jgi:glycosyltransferase involved in cell wall biosynthesis